MYIYIYNYVYIVGARPLEGRGFFVIKGVSWIKFGYRSIHHQNNVTTKTVLC